MVLSAIGLFGAVAHDVAARRTELALRLALGADPLRILWNTSSRGIQMVGAGLAVGAVCSIWAARALEYLLSGTGGFDPVNLAIAAAMLLLAGVGAILPSARRAARTDPLVALRLG